MGSFTLNDFCNSPFWDGNLTWYTDDPDFTPCFQKTILVWVPCAILWLFLPLEITLIAKSERRSVRCSHLSITKSLLVFLLAAISVLKFAKQIYYGDFQVVDNLAVVLQFGTYILALFLIIYGRGGGTVLSGILTMFWFLLTLTKTITLRSTIMKYYLQNDKDDYFGLAIESVIYPLVVITLVLHTMSDVSPHYEKHTYEIEVKMKSSEDDASFCSRVVHSWLSSALWKGWKRNLEPSDVYDLNHAERALTVSRLFQKHWKPQTETKRDRDEMEMKRFSEERNRTKYQSKSISRPLLRTVGPCLILGVFLQFLSDVVSVGPALLTGSIIDYSSSEDPLWKGIFYACLYGLAGLAQSLLQEGSAIFHTKLGLRLKSATMHVLYKKIFRLTSSDRRDLTMGEILNTMYVDTNRFQILSPQLGLLWSVPVQTVLCFAFMYQELGYSAFAGIVPIVVLLTLNYVSTKKYKALQIELMKLKDKRMKMMSEILNGIRVLKLYAWEESFQRIVLEIRKKETALMKKQGFFEAINGFIAALIPVLITSPCFAMYVLIDDDNVLTSRKAFVSYQLVRLLAASMLMFPELINTLVLTHVSVRRIANLLIRGETKHYVEKISSDAQYAIEIEKGTFHWDAEDPAAASLQDINLKVSRGSLVAVVGTVGCGKSSLLSALVPEMQKVEGEVRVAGRVGYVTQQPWIQNASLRQNILFVDDMDQERYDSVIRACALQPDLDQLPADDETEIGERGINLSGGQKQRVNVARAIYRDDDVYLFDDPLGAVDSHVAKHLFNEVIGPKGLLRNKTRVLVTHNLSFIREVDEIFFMNDGRIIERGTYDEIMNRQGMARDYFSQHMSDMSDENKEEPSTLNIKVERFPIASQGKVSGEDEAKLMTKETLKEGNISVSQYKQFFQAYGRTWYAIFAVAITGAVVFNIASVYWLSLWCADSKEDFKANPDLKATRIAVLVVLGLGQAITGFYIVFVNVFCCLRAANCLHAKMLESVFRSPMSFFDTTPLGRILNRFSQDIDALDQQLPRLLRVTNVGLIYLVVYTIAVAIYLPLFIIPCIVVVIGYLLLQRFLMSSNRQFKRITSLRNSFLFSHVGGSVAGSTVVRACDAGQNFEGQFLKLIDECTAANYMMNMAQRWLTVRYNILGNCLMFCIAIFIILSRETLSADFVGLILANADRNRSNEDDDTGRVIPTGKGLLQYLKNFISGFTGLESNVVSIERVDEYSRLESEAEWEKPESQPPADWPQRGQITFQEYSTKYREGLDLVLKDINVRIEAGEKVGVVGRTGAGKSSLTLALFRLIEGVRGPIVIDGVEVEGLGLSDLRSRLTIIPQEPVLFSGTLRLNLDPFGQKDDHRLWAALEHSHLKSFVASLEQGLDHPVAEGGNNLSVGQRQLVCLARALLRNTKILILDEATASVDMDTDDLIQETIKKEFANSTIITIAHRINTILDYDKVMVLDQGRIVEFDSPDALLKNEESMFYDLAKDANLI